MVRPRVAAPCRAAIARSPLFDRNIHLANAPDRALDASDINSFIDQGFLASTPPFRRSGGSGTGDPVARSRSGPRRSTHGPSCRPARHYSDPRPRGGERADPHTAFDQLWARARLPAARSHLSDPLPFRSGSGRRWHVDVSFGTENPDFMEWRVNLHSRGRALLMLFLFSDVGVDDAPTRIRAGCMPIRPSTRSPVRRPDASRARFDGFAASAAVRKSCDGKGGHGLSCHPFLVHRPSASRTDAPLHGPAAAALRGPCASIVRTALIRRSSRQS